MGEGDGVVLLGRRRASAVGERLAFPIELREGFSGSVSRVGEVAPMSDNRRRAGVEGVAPPPAGRVDP